MFDKLSIHVMTTWKNKSRQESILQTWLKDHSDYIFYTDKVTGIGNQVVAFDNDTYYSNGIKHLSELNRVYSQELYLKYDWFLFCDDDTHLNMNLIKKTIPSFNTDTCYGNIINSFSEDPSLDYFSGGAGYFVPANILKTQGVPNLDYLKKSFYSDVCFGFWMRDNSIKKQHLSTLMQYPPDHYNMLETDICKYMSFHYIKEHRDRINLENYFTDTK